MEKYKYQIFSDISEWVMYDFSAFVDSIPDEADVTIEITSHGGLVFYGNAIFQKIQEAQRRGVKFNARVYGLAASSAADIVLACDRIGMASTAAIMIHSAWVVDVEETHKHDPAIEIANAAQLSVIRRRLPEYTEQDLKADRWFRADEAKKIGLIDYIFDFEADSLQARLCAKYLGNSGGVNMEEEKKEEMQEEKKAETEESEKDGSQSLEDLIERMIERVESIEKRLEMLEEAKGECGDRRDNARLKSLFDRISAVSKPCVSGDSVLRKDTEDPKAALESYKAKYPNIDRLLDVE